MSTVVYVAPVFLVSDLERSLEYYRQQLGFEIDFTYEGFYAGVASELAAQFEQAGAGGLLKKALLLVPGRRTLETL